MPKRLAAVVIALSCGLAVAPAGAAQLSTSDIISALTPGAARGIRPVDGGAPAAADVPVRAADGCPAGPAPSSGVASVDLSVLFATNSAELGDAGFATLDSLGHALASPALAGYRFLIEGHTDTTGGETLNRDLSARRADTVVRYLAARHAIDRARLNAVGRGSDGLAVPTGPGVDEKCNRRVRIVNVGR